MIGTQCLSFSLIITQKDSQYTQTLHNFNNLDMSQETI